MGEKIIATIANPTIILKSISGDLQLCGGEESQIKLKSSNAEQTEIQIVDDVYTFSCSDDCIAYIPHSSSVQIGNIGGDGIIRELEGDLSINSIGGDISLRDVSKTDIQTVGGDMIIKRGHGGISIASIGGSALLRNIEGSIDLRGVGGAMNIDMVSGSVKAVVGGDAVLNLSPVAWHTYKVSTGGDTIMQLADETNANLSLESHAKKIVVNKNGHREIFKQTAIELKLGDGGADISIDAGGIIRVDTGTAAPERPTEFDIDISDEIGDYAEEIADRVTRQLDDHLAILESQIEGQISKLTASLPVEMTEKSTKEIRLRIEEAKRKAERRAESAAERAKMKLVRKFAAAQKRVERKAHAEEVREMRKQKISKSKEDSYSLFDDTTDIVGRDSHRQKDREAEKLCILNMIENKIITIEEAETLLKAIE